MEEHYTRKMQEDERNFFDHELQHGSPPSRLRRIWNRTDKSLRESKVRHKVTTLWTWGTRAKNALAQSAASKPQEITSYTTPINLEFFKRKVLKASLSLTDRNAGWRLFKPRGRSKNAFLSSSELNKTILTDGNWNPHFVDDRSNAHYAKLLARVSTHKQHARAMIVAKIEKAMSDPKARPLINERKIALTSDIDAKTTRINVFQSCYFASMLTTDISCKDFILSNGLGDTYISKAKLNFPFQNEEERDCIPSISHSAQHISNQLGINIILLTKDNYLVFPRQHLEANQHAGEIMPSASGSMDWEDFADRPERLFREVCHVAAMREIREELGQNFIKIQNSGKLQTHKFFITGIYRGLIRGGKPDVAAFGVLDWRLDELRAQPNEIVDLDNNPVTRFEKRTEQNTYAVKVKNVDELKAEVNRIWTAKREASISLDATVHCLSEAIESHPQLFEEIFTKG